MIARVWKARTTREQAPAYVSYFTDHVLPAVRGIAGYVDSFVMQRDDSNGVEVVVTTFWRSLEAIRRFAGDDVEAAVVDEAAKPFVTDFDRRVRHYDVVVEDRRKTG